MAETTIRADRLLKLADYLETVPDEAFCLRHWKCNGAGCAFGHACSIPEFRDAGLWIRVEDGYACPCFGGEVEFEAAEAFFGIDSDEARLLFDPTEYFSGGRGKWDVARRIRDFVRSETDAHAAAVAARGE